jgi:hypothetical protein|tara:strand:- start:167 stop:1093 length:927 start_codon:yes stop_codon:yes gene_type:complete
MAYITDYQYYENGGVDPKNANWGSYQYVSLADIVTNFLLMYSGNHSLVNNEERYKIMFHAKRGIQELNYDALKEIKILELSVCQTLRYVLPPDYVNWVRMSLYQNGVLRPLTENIQTNWSNAYLQDNDCNILFDIDGNIARPEFSDIDYDRITNQKKSIYLNQNNPQFDGMEGYNVDGGWWFDYQIGARFGLNTETANANPTFSINKKSGVINFSSEMNGELCILEYVSDGMENGVNSEISLNKMFEEYIYAYIQYSILDAKFGVQEYVVNRAKKKKAALLRNAKIRMSSIDPGKLLMNLRGQDKWIK